jgi:small conductance mechanosensitive channel
MPLDLSAPINQLHEMANGALARLPYIVLAVLVFFAFYFAAKGIRKFMGRVSARRQHVNLSLVLGRLTQGGVVLLGLLVALVIALPSFKPAQLIQILGLSSVAIGFAFKDILQNFLAGILLLLNEPFRIGDQIIMGDFEGTVENIETRATFIKTYDGRRVVIPNGHLYANSVVVNTAFNKRRIQYDVGIGYGDDVARAKALLLESVRGVEGTLEDPPPEVLVVDLAGSTVNLRVRWWIDPPRRRDVIATTDLVLEAAKAKLTANGIDLPYPTRQILFHDQTETGDGDRSRQREGWPAGAGAVPRPRAESPPADGTSKENAPAVNRPA